MFLLTLSVNHNTAAVKVREKIAFNDGDLPNALKKLNAIESVCASVILSTCNRLEFYISSQTKGLQEELVQFLADYHSIDVVDIKEHVSYLESEQSLRHMCNVAAGLDSLVMGEPQILGQLKNAYGASKLNSSLDSYLEKVFQHVFSVAKKVRTETEIGKNPVSVAYCGVKLSEKFFSDISKQTALLIGAGEMIELSAQHLKNKNIKQLIVANRTKENAEKITEIHGGLAISLTNLAQHIHKADIVITSTAAPIAIIGKGMIESAIKQRKHKPMFILDIAVPRDVEEQVEELNDVYLYTVDNLNQVIDENKDSRNKSKEVATEIIDKQNDIFIKELENIEHIELVKKYNTHANIIKTDLVEKALKNVDDEEVQQLVHQLADRLTNTLIHNNFINIKQVDTAHISHCNKCIPKIKT